LRPDLPFFFPRDFHPSAGRATTIGGEPPPVSMIWSSPPSSVGSPAGRLKAPSAFAFIFTSCPSWTWCMSPGISSSAAHAWAAASRLARPTAILTEVRRMRCPPISVVGPAHPGPAPGATRAGAPPGSDSAIP
jgi:hypothetical protein